VHCFHVYSNPFIGPPFLALDGSNILSIQVVALCIVSSCLHSMINLSISSK
jgi:hypothetical protein